MGGPVILVTGSCGLVGSALIRYLGGGIGVDNDSRAVYFGKSGSTFPVALELMKNPGYVHHGADIRDASAIDRIFEEHRPTGVVHCAAQPAHEWSKRHPREDYDINVTGTVNILDAARRYCPTSPFVFVSSSKVYGTSINGIELIEGAKRWDYYDTDGVDESHPLDGSWHSPYGAHKAAADIIAQEYAHEYQMPVTVLRPNCMTGHDHAGVEMHGFLNYLVKSAMAKRTYKAFGYGGKQVRDNIHADDVVSAIMCCLNDPTHGEAFNIGGGRGTDVSILEMVDHMARWGFDLSLEMHNQRGADHICYITDNSKFRQRYNWEPTYTLDDIITDIVGAVEYSRHSPPTGAGAKTPVPSL